MTEGLSERADKVYKAMKEAGITSEDKMANVDRIVSMARMPKNFVLSALQELVQKGFARRKAREKVAGYYLVK
ncbi:MAG: transcriptional regulator [Candidatus Thermoplasmatota archaeon]|nr:transcriptional regulator [Candidatus Thermoplasmatota archaeon]MDI6887132.1 transcriptional regulator [Candidatus Thermoplasmatota archaeon]